MLGIIGLVMAVVGAWVVLQSRAAMRPMLHPVWMIGLAMVLIWALR